MKHHLFSRTSVTLFGSLWIAAGADLLDSWQWCSPLPQGNDLYSLAYGQDRYVAVGSYGTILVSQDGRDWTMQSLETNKALRGVTFGNGQFVAVGEAYSYGYPGADVLLTSPDGATWLDYGGGTTNGLTSVAYGNGLFVAVGILSNPATGSPVLTSTDGVAWTKRAVAAQSGLVSVTWGNGRFVAVGGSWLHSSTDGVTWEATLAPTHCFLNQVGFGNGVFVAVGSDSLWPQNPIIVSSTNGRDWVLGNLPTLPESGAGMVLTSVAWGGNRFVTMATQHGMGSQYRLEANVTWISQDGLTWSHAADLPILQRPTALLWAADQFVAVGEFGNIATSSDGENWLPISRATSNNLRGVHYGNGLFVAVGNGGTNLSSPDGISWTARASGTSRNLRDLTFEGGQFVAVGTDGTILTSPDASRWTQQVSGTLEDLFEVAWGNGTFVAVGGSSHGSEDDRYYTHALLTGTDGTNWTTRLAGSGFRLHGVTFGNGLFVAVGEPGAVLTSADGISWSRQDTGAYLYFKSVAFGQDRFVAVGESPAIFSSTDGLNWVFHTVTLSLPYFELDEVEFGDGTFVAVGSTGIILSSTNGVDWTQRHSPTTTNLRGLASADGFFVIVGNNDTILGPGVRLPMRLRFVQQPRSQFAHPGESVTLSAAAVGEEPLAFQWLCNGTSLSGATHPALVLTNVQVSDSGAYTVMATSGNETVSSAVAYLAVTTMNPLDLWQRRDSWPPTNSFYSVAYGQGKFVVAGLVGTTLASTDGVNWNPSPAGTTQTLLHITYGSGLFVAVGGVGEIFTSPDGHNWVRGRAGPGPAFWGITYGNGLFAAVGESGWVITSPDGVNWTNRLGSGPPLRGVAHGQDRFVAVSSSGYLVFSTNGVNWTIQGGAPSLYGIAYGGGRFVAVGPNGAVLTSTDGVHWTSANAGTMTMLGIAFANGFFIAVGPGGAILSSSDGINWTRHNSGIFNTLWDITEGNGCLLAVGEGGTILQTYLLPTPPFIAQPPQSKMVPLGGLYTNSVRAAGLAPLSYQWLFNGTNLPGATNLGLVITNLPLTAEGDYAVVVANLLGAATSAVARLTVGRPPIITQEPLGQAIVEGGSVTFSVEVSGTAPFTYRWRKPGSVYITNVLAENISFLSVADVQSADAGVYGVIVSNPFGTVLAGVSLSVLSDNDEDGMADAWELAYGMNTNAASDAEVDWDGDGMSNLEEYQAGTDPTRASSLLRIDALLHRNGLVTLSFRAASNHTYGIQYQDALAGSDWLRLQDIVARATNRSEIVTDLIPVPSGRFYRLVTPRQP